MKPICYYQPRLQKLSADKKKLIVKLLGYDIFFLLQQENNSLEQLVAYVIPNENEPLDSKELQNYLAEKLPYYMLPAEIIILKHLPLMPNGKLSIAMLPAPKFSQKISYQKNCKPRNDIEATLTKIWQEVLNRSEISIDDNFFEIGGHSLLAAKIIARLKIQFGNDISLRALFEKPTIAEFAVYLQQIYQNTTNLPNIIPVANAVEIPLSWSQEPLWRFNQINPENAAYNMAGVVRIEGQVNHLIITQCFNQIIQRHEILRSYIVNNKEGQPILKSFAELNITIPVVDVFAENNNLDNSYINKLLHNEATLPFVLNQAPLFRVQLFKLKEQEYLLLVILHHIIADGWSINVLIKEFISLYSALMTDKDPILPILPIQYKDYAVWQRQFLQADNLKQKMAYAKQQLSGAPAYSGLPPDHSRLPVQTFNGKIFQHVYSATLNNALHLLCKKESTTLFTVLLMAFQLLLSRYTGQNDIVVGVPNANRHSTMMENLIGCFITTLVVRNQFFAALTINEMLQRTHEALLESYQYQDLPFEKLLEGLAIKRSSAIHPLFQVMFVLQNADQMTESLTVSNLKLSVLELNNDVAKFDLTLSISESEQGLVGKFEYNSDLYNEHTIILLAQHYGELLEGIVANPQRRVSELSFASTPLINSVSLCPQSREYIEGEL